MMTKNKSRFTAKLKALLVIPVAIITFFLFAHMTVASPVLNFTNFSSVKVSNLDGIWINNSDSFGKLLLFNGSNLSILESDKKVDVIDLNITIKDKEILLNRFGPETESLKYQLSGSELKIWWNENEYSTYIKTDYENSFDALKANNVGDISLPTAKFAKILDKTYLLINVYVLNDKYVVDGESCSLNELKAVFSKRVANFNIIDRSFVTTRIVVDEETEMGPVFQLYQVLRELRYYKIAYASFPESGASVLQYHSVGLPQMLPPTEADGAKLMQIEDIEEGVFALQPRGNLKQKKNELTEFIKTNPSDIISFVWNNSTKYGDYVACIDMVFDVLYEYRNQYAMEQYNIKYTELPKNLQKQVRKQYPMRLSQRNSDEE